MTSLTPVHQLKGSEPQPARSALTSRILGVPPSTFWPFLPGSPRGLAFPDCAFKAIPAYAAALSRAEPWLVVCNLVLSVPHTRPHSSEPGLGALPRGMKALKTHPELSNGLYTESLLSSHSFTKASQNTYCIWQAGIGMGMRGKQWPKQTGALVFWQHILWLKEMVNKNQYHSALNVERRKA